MITIVTDTSANLPSDLIEQYRIVQAPIYLYFGGDTYRENIDLDSAGMLARLYSGEVPTTSEPPAQEFRDIYTHILSDHPEAAILSIHVSGALSGTLASAQQAAEQIPRANICVIDSRTCTVAHAMQVIEAAEMAQEGASVEEVLNRLQAIQDQMQFYLAMETLGPLASSGRLWRLSRMAATLGRMKPLVNVEEGTLNGVDKYARSEEAVSRLLGAAASMPTGARVGIIHANRRDDAQILAEALQAEAQPEHIYLTEFSPAFTYYFSPGALGVAWYI